MLTQKEQETKAFLELAKQYEMALEEIKALREQIRILENQLHGSSH